MNFRIYFLTILFSILINEVYAQNFLHEFGKYSNEEFQLKACPFERSAEAVVIYDIGRSSFELTDRGYEMIFEHTFKIKVFTKAGIKHAEISIPLFDGDEGPEVIASIKANTYNLENGIVSTTAYNKSELYTEKVNDKLFIKKFAIPDVKEGSIFEVSYMVKSPYYFQLRDWDFQGSIPVLHSEYTAIMHPRFEYVYNLQGANKFDEFKRYEIHNTRLVVGDENTDDVAYFFAMKNLPSFVEDEFVSSKKDYIVRLNFQMSAYVNRNGVIIKILTTWPELTKELLNSKDFGKYLKSAENHAEDILKTMTLPAGDEEKARYLRKWLTGNITFDRHDSKYANKSVKELYTLKTGNSAEMNLYYIGMLRAAGLEADPVIISTRSNGKIMVDYPYLDAFNYVMAVAVINGKPLLIDATESVLRFEDIPIRCLNEKGLIVNSKDVQWLNFNSRMISESKQKVNLTILPEKGTFEESCSLKYTGYEAAIQRSNYLAEYDNLVASLVHENYTIADSIKHKNLYDIDAPFELEFTETLPLESADGKLVIEPFCGRALKENPLKQTNRSYPIDFNYKKSKSFETIINIPEGYKLLSKPEDFVANNSTVKIIYTVDDSQPGIIKVTGHYEFMKDMYTADAYQNLKSCFNLIVNKFNDKIILEPTEI